MPVMSENWGAGKVDILITINSRHSSCRVIAVCYHAKNCEVLIEHTKVSIHHWSKGFNIIQSKCIFWILNRNTTQFWNQSLYKQCLSSNLLALIYEEPRLEHQHPRLSCWKDLQHITKRYPVCHRLSSYTLSSVSLANGNSRQAIMQIQLEITPYFREGPEFWEFPR